MAASLQGDTSVVAQMIQPPVVPGQKKDIVLGGVAFESSGRSLVRKDCELWKTYILCLSYYGFYIVPKMTSTAAISIPPTIWQSIRKPGHVAAGRAFRLKARRGRNMTLNNNKRPYQWVIARDLCRTLTSAVDHVRRLRSENSLTNHVQGLQQRVCTLCYFPFQGWILFLFVTFLYTCSHEPFCSFASTFVANNFRCLQPGVDLSLSTRPIQDCYLLEFPSGSLLEQYGDLQSITRSDTRTDANLSPFLEQGAVYS